MTPAQEDRLWPGGRPFSGAGFARVDTSLSCVLTRFRLRSWWSLIAFYFAFRRIRDASKHVGGLLKAVFLVENAHTCYTISLWRDEWGIVEFGRVRAHVDAANSVLGATYRGGLGRAEIWSAQFKLWAVSCHNSNWEGLDLEQVLGDQWARRGQVAEMGVEMKAVPRNV